MDVLRLPTVEPQLGHFGEIGSMHRVVIAFPDCGAIIEYVATR